MHRHTPDSIFQIMTTPIRVAVTGAAGQIGYSLLFRIASGAMFGPNQPVILHLIEIEPALLALTGVAMELDDCAFPLLKGVVPTANLDEGFKGVNWALLVGSVPRKAGMERKDLLGISGAGGFQFIQKYTGFISPGIVAVFVLGMFWKRSTGHGAFTGLLAGTVAAVTRLLFDNIEQAVECGEMVAAHCQPQAAARPALPARSGQVPPSTAAADHPPSAPSPSPAAPSPGAAPPKGRPRSASPDRSAPW